MEKLAKTIKTVTEHGHEYTLREAAAEWATYCVNELDGLLLQKGLKISEVLTNFINEFDDKS